MVLIKLNELTPGSYYDWKTLTLTNSWTDLATYKTNMADWWCLGNPSEIISNGTFTTAGEAVWNACYTAYTTETMVVSGSNITINHKKSGCMGS